MSDKTGIEWTDATWNPIRGCSRVSEGCRNCYAEKVANRFKGPGQPYEGLIARGGQWSGQITVAEHLMDWPLRKRKPMRIFVNSMSDLFHENVPFDMVHRIMMQMDFANHHTYQVLTKRPARMLEFFDWWGTEAKRRFAAEMPHIWLGVSVEDQATADERIPLLLQTPSAVRWISAEPLLGPIDFSGRWVPYENPAIHENMLERLDWVVVGGESGKNARPMQLNWARTLRDQCQSAGVPFFFKQWGEWLPDNQNPAISGPSGASQAIRVGKKQAGRLLDGREWNEYPGATA